MVVEEKDVLKDKVIIKADYEDSLRDKFVLNNKEVNGCQLLLLISEITLYIIIEIIINKNIPVITKSKLNT